MFQEANMLELENRSTSQTRRFKIFEESQVFPKKRLSQHLLKQIDGKDKHDECDYETEAEHVEKAHALMLEDVLESIKYYVDNKPTGLIYNLRYKRK